MDDIDVCAGQALAFVNNRAIAAADGFVDLISCAVKALPDSSYDIATIYLGADIDPSTADALVPLLAEALGVEVEISTGGQRHYDYIISVE